MKIRPVGADADGRTERDVTKLVVVFRSFTNVPKKITTIYVIKHSCAPFFFIRLIL